jgi:hypothetical protein
MRDNAGTLEAIRARSRKHRNIVEAVTQHGCADSGRGCIRGSSGTGFINRLASHPPSRSIVLHEDLVPPTSLAPYTRHADLREDAHGQDHHPRGRVLGHD